MTNQTFDDVMTKINGSNIIAIASGKGGVGKTWLSISLAQALAQKDKKVLLFDGALGLSNIDIMLGLNTTADISSVLSGKTPLTGAITHDNTINCDVIAGVSGSQTMAGLAEPQLQVLIDDLKIMSQHYDNVIMDLNSGIDETVMAFAKTVETIFVITTDEPTALADAYAFIKLITNQHPTATIKIIINFANTQKEGERTYYTLLNACQSFLMITPELLGVIRHDSNVKECIKKQTSFITAYPDSPITQDIKIIADKI